MTKQKSKKLMKTYTCCTPTVMHIDIHEYFFSRSLIHAHAHLRTRKHTQACTRTYTYANTIMTNNYL